MRVLFLALVVSIIFVLNNAFNAFLNNNGRMGRILSKYHQLKMAQTNVNMPALSSTMTEGKIVSWSKKVGDKVSAGDVLLVVESDKADMDVESFEDGFLAAILTPEGGSAAVGSPVAIIVDKKEDINNVSKTPAAPVTSAPVPPVSPVPSSTTTSSSKPANCENVNMPALSSTMKEGKIVSWSKKVGDKVSSGDVLLVVESDKADMDVESYEDGFLAAIVVKDGEVAEVGAPVALIAKSAADIPAVQAYAAILKSGGASTAAPVTPVTPTVSQAAPVTVSAPAGAYVPQAGTINATPMARKLASDNGLDVTKIKGTGNFNRVTADDVLIAAGKTPATKAPPTPVSTTAPAATSKAAPATAVEVLDGVKAMDGMQKAVAKNMEKSLVVPIFRVSREIVTDKFDELYAVLKPKGVTVSAMLAKAVAETLKKHPIVNAAYVEGGIKYNKDINVAMAVAIDGGLITPTIIKAQDQDLFSISRTWKELVEKAKNKKLSSAEYSSGTFTISNLGMFGVQQFDAILPSGTGSILAIAASTPKVIQTKDGKLAVQKSMTVTITCDHRHI